MRWSMGWRPFCALPPPVSELAPDTSGLFDTQRPKRQGLESMKSPSYDPDQELVQLATRIPRRVARRLKEFCVRNDVRLQNFVRTALAEKLTRERGSLKQRRQAGG
jgi:hypothetical protein